MNLDGKKTTSPHIRDDTISWKEHLLRSRSRIQGQHVIGFVGTGNVTMNPEFIGFSNGKVYYVRTQSFERRFPTLLSTRQGVVFQHVQCSPSRSFGSEGLVGPQLVSDGQAITNSDLSQMTSEGAFYDLRHVIQFPCIRWNGGGLPGATIPPPSIDIGLERFWRDGEIDQEATVRAIRGDSIELDIEPYLANFPPAGEAIGLNRLRTSMAMHGYVQTDHPQSPGEWKLASDRIEVIYYQGIYNHSLLGTSAGGDLVWLGITSHGGQAGMTLLDTARLAADCMTDGILVDNGGDVMCRLANEWVVPSIHGREKIRAILVLMGSKNSATHDTYHVKVRPISHLRGRRS